MTTQYDPIAQKYDEIIQDVPIRQMVEYTYQNVIGDVAGKSVLDLACGNGLYTRTFKHKGAARVVGVDLSEELIRLARLHETQDPLGIDYIVADGQRLGKIGDFDVVTSAFLLNFAPTKEALLDMCRSVYENLQGNHFVAINFNVHEAAAVISNDVYRKYGVFYELVDGSIADGATIRMTVAQGQEQIQFNIYHLPPEVFEWALHTAGFTTVTWHNPQLSPQIEQRYGKPHWQSFLDTPSNIIIECRK